MNSFPAPNSFIIISTAIKFTFCPFYGHYHVVLYLLIIDNTENVCLTANEMARDIVSYASQTQTFTLHYLNSVYNVCTPSDNIYCIGKTFLLSLYNTEQRQLENKYIKNKLLLLLAIYSNIFYNVGLRNLLTTLVNMYPSLFLFITLSLWRSKIWTSNIICNAHIFNYSIDNQIYDNCC